MKAGIRYDNFSVALEDDKDLTGRDIKGKALLARTASSEILPPERPAKGLEIESRLLSAHPISHSPHGGSSDGEVNLSLRAKIGRAHV